MSHEQLQKYHDDSVENEIMFLQVGGFYEAYHFPDGVGSGKDVSRLLNILLTSKKPNEPWSMTNPKFSGFPVNSLQKYLTILNDMRYVVSVFDQEKNNPKVRFLRGKYTENIRMDTENMNELPENSRIFSVVLEKYFLKGHRERIVEYKLNYSFLEVRSFKLFFGEIMEQSFLRLVEKFFLQNQPTEFIFSVNSVVSDDEKECLLKIMKENNVQFPKIEELSTESIQDKWDQIRTRFTTPPSLEYFPMIIESLHQLVSYIDNHVPNYGKRFFLEKNPWLITDDNPYLVCNRDLFSELFLFEVQKDRKQFGYQTKSVFEMLSKSMNPVAKRTLYRKLQYPMTNVSAIQQSYEKIETASHDVSFYQNLIDVEYYYTRWERFTITESKLGCLLQNYRDLKEKYPQLDSFLHDVELRWNIDKMMVKEDFIKNLSEECLLWKESYDNFVHKLRQNEIMEKDITLQFSDDILNSYYTITNARWKKWNVSKQNQYRIISNNSCSKRIMLKEYEILFPEINSFYVQIRKYLHDRFTDDSNYFFQNYRHVLEDFHQCLGEDSMYSSLRSFFVKQGYSKPSVYESPTFEVTIENGRHGLMEHLYPDDLFTPFSCQMDNTKRGQLIYGVNGSGKSTYMKTICLILWFAQCGFWVPVRSMTFTPLRVLFTKFKHMDNLFRKHSTYVMEISELKYILDRLDKKTLLCFDEFPVGTEIYSSSGLLCSLLERFVKDHYHFMITTHIPFISDYVTNHFPGLVDVFHFKMNTIDLSDPQLLLLQTPNNLYDRQMLPGTGVLQYGLEVASQLGISSDIIDRAKEIRKHVKFEFTEKPGKSSRYNCKLEMTECVQCGARDNLQTHHRFQQENFRENNTTKDGFRKNGLYNLTILCRSCHEKLHHS